MYQFAVVLMIVLLIVTIALTITFITLEVTHNPLRAFWFKGFASLGFILLAASSFIFQQALFGNAAFQNDMLFVALFLPGLVCGLMGDLYLALRTLRPVEENRRLILGGTICFAIGHLFYYGALLLVGGFHPWAVVVAIGLAVVIYVASIVMKMAWGWLKYPLMIYSFLVFLVASQGVAMAIAAAPAGAFETLVAAGGILFAVSDLILSQIYFKGKTGGLFVTANLVTYYAAQILLALSLYFFE